MVAGGLFAIYSWRMRLARHQAMIARNKELATFNEKLAASNERNYQQAITDQLTGVFNRTYLMNELEKLNQSERRRTRRALLMLDVDHFKAVNDQYGHLAGDEVVKRLAGVIQSTLREDDFLSRFGGEEFLVVLSDSSAEEAKLVAEKIRAAIEQAFDGQDAASPGVTASIGVASEPRKDQTITQWLKRADDAVYQAKSDGRNRVVAN